MGQNPKMLPTNREGFVPNRRALSAIFLPQQQVSPNHRTPPESLFTNFSPPGPRNFLWLRLRRAAKDNNHCDDCDTVMS